MDWNELLKILNETGFYVDNQIKDGIGFYIEKIRIRNSDEYKYGFGLHCKKRKKELSIYNDKILSELTNKGWTISGKTINKEYSFQIGYEKENEKETTKRKGYFVFKEYKPNAQLKLEDRFGQFKEDIEKSGILKLFNDNIDKFLLSDQKQTDTPSQNQTPGKKTKEKKNSGKTAESKICLAETNEVNSAINWSKVQVPDGDFWRDSAHNPWINPIWAVDAPFILQEDWEKEGFSKKCCNSQEKTKDDQIITDIFPQPYIGDPQAPFWILQINPSYSPADIFDMQKIVDAQKVEEIKKEIQKEIKNNVEIFHKEVLESDGSQKEKCFLSRKKLLEQQLVFEEPHFYVLDEEFETIAETGKKLIGSYKWWKAALVGKSHLSGEDINLAKTMFFCLESLPYHSRKRGYVEALRPLTKHWGFWQKMIKYALNNDKKIFIRGQELYRLIEGLITKDNRKNIFILNPQRQYLSLGNILTVVSEQQQDELKDIVERRKNGLR